MMNEEVKQFIEENIELIEQQRWEESYRKRFPIGFTETLLESNINPLEQGLTYIPDNFLRSSTIKEFIIPNNVTSIGVDAFADCGNLTSIVIPNSVRKIDHVAFLRCYKLTNLNYLGTIDDWAQINFYPSYGGYYCETNPLTYTEKLYLNNILAKEIELCAPQISKHAFSHCKSLEKVSFKDTKDIGILSFSYCENIRVLLLSNKVQSIGNSAFDNCINLEKVIIENNLSLNIGDSIFQGCSKLYEIKYLGTKKQAMQLGIGNKSRKKWREGSVIKKIICTDGEIEL